MLLTVWKRVDVYFRIFGGTTSCRGLHVSFGGASARWVDVVGSSGVWVVYVSCFVGGNGIEHNYKLLEGLLMVSSFRKVLIFYLD